MGVGKCAPISSLATGVLDARMSVVWFSLQRCVNYHHLAHRSQWGWVGATAFKLESGVIAQKWLFDSSVMAPEMPFRLECGSIAQKCLRHLNYFIAREQVEQKKKQTSVFGFRPLVVWFVRSLWSICSTWGRTFSSTSELGLWNFDP